MALAAVRLARIATWYPTTKVSSIVWSQRWLSSYPTHVVVGMPSLSPTMESGTIASWNKKEGEAFIAGDSLCTVETDKATVDFEAQDEGVIAKILAQAGPAEIKCGEPILITVESKDDVDAFSDYVMEGATTPPPSSSSPPPPPPVAASPPPSSSTSPPPTPPVVAEPAPPSPTPPAPPTSPAPATSTTLPGGRVVASPLAHMLAKEMGHDISSILGTGPGGRVIAADVKEFVPSAAAVTTTTTAVEVPATVATPAAAVATTIAAAPAQQAVMTAAAAAATAPMPGGYTDYPLSVSAQETAMALTHSKQNVPHYYLTVDICMDSLLTMRSSLNTSLDRQLGTYEFLLKAAAVAMKACPLANASWMDSVVRVYDSVDINVVVGNGDAFYTPVLRNVARRGIASISDDLVNFVAATTTQGTGEENKLLLLSNEVFGAMGTFTVMNLGMYGIKSCAPIIREPQACALALGVMENRIVPSNDEEGELYKESIMMTATLSCDHRVVDGAVGAQWLSAFKSHVENPNTLLL